MKKLPTKQEDSLEVFLQMCHKQIVPDFIKRGALVSYKLYFQHQETACVIDYFWELIPWTPEKPHSNDYEYPDYQLVVNIMTPDEKIIKGYAFTDVFQLDS